MWYDTMKLAVTCVYGEDNILKRSDILRKQNTSTLMRTVKQTQLVDLMTGLSYSRNLKTDMQEINEQKVKEEEEIEEILKEFSDF